jgi:cold shock protein
LEELRGSECVDGKIRGVAGPKRLENNGWRSANRPIATGPGGLHDLELQFQRRRTRRAAPLIGHDRRENVMAQQGTIKFFNADKGYGFIRPSDGGKDIFVHITALEQAGLASLNEGQKISFEIEPDKKGKGPKAVNLHVE